MLCEPLVSFPMTSHRSQKNRFPWDWPRANTVILKYKREVKYRRTQSHATTFMRIQWTLPFKWELNDGMKFPLKRSRPFSYFNVLIFGHNRRIDLSLRSRLGFLQRQQLGGRRGNQQGLGSWQRSFGKKEKSSRQHTFLRGGKHKYVWMCVRLLAYLSVHLSTCLSCFKFS